MRRGVWWLLVPVVAGLAGVGVVAGWVALRDALVRFDTALIFDVFTGVQGP